MALKQHSTYLKIEVIFFITYFYVFSLITDLEYNFWERSIKGITRPNLEDAIFYGTSSMIAFYVYYLIVKRYLENKNLGKFVLYIALFLIGYSFYQKAVHFLGSQLDFLSEEFRKYALRAYKSKSIGYSLVYMFREFLSFSCLAYFIHTAKQDEQLKALKEQQLISELTYLKAQLQPHFFFNTLNNIYSLALQQSKDTAPLVAKLAAMMRYILYKSADPFVLLKDEISFIQNYVDVEQIRYRSTIVINFEVQGIDDHSKIGPLLLLPFIENAFKHGIEEETGNGFVDIVICKTEHELVLQVSNSIPSSNVKKEVGIGLINAQKRLSILYPTTHQLEIKKTAEIYTVNLTLS